MVRGRPMNTALPETRGLVQQRKFRAKKAEKIAELESTNRALVEENKQLRTELQLMRDHLLNPDASSRPFEKVEKEKEKEDRDEIRIQMGVVQGVRDQLENALQSLRAIGGDVDMRGGSQASPLSMSSHAAGTPVASTPHPYFGQNGNNQIDTSLEVSIEPSQTVASTKCCKRPTTDAPIPVPVNHYDNYDNYDTDRISKRQRQTSTSTEPLRTFQSGSPVTEIPSTPISRRPSSAIRDMSPPVDRRVPPINSAECCLGIVACDERGEIVGWTS